MSYWKVLRDIVFIPVLRVRKPRPISGFDATIAYSRKPRALPGMKSRYLSYTILKSGCKPHHLRE